MKAKKVGMLIALGVSLIWTSPAVVGYADTINTQSVKTSASSTGIINFSELGYTDIMSDGTWDSNFVSILNNGTKVTIIGENTNWYEINYEGKTAWVLKNRVKVLPKEIIGTGTISFNELGYTDIMSEGTWDSNFVSILNNGTKVNIVGESNSWYEIEYNGGTAWVLKNRVNTSSKKTIINTGVINFNELSYTDIMSQGNWNSNFVDTLNNGTSVNIIGENANWYEIEYGNSTAWVMKNRVNTLHEKVIGTGTISFDELGYTDIMSEGTWDSNFVDTLNNGTSINIVGENTNWYKIEYNNQNAWVLKNRVNTLIDKKIIANGIIDFSGLSYTDIMSQGNWNSNFVATLNNGTSVDIVSENTNWYEIKYNGGTAWVLKNRVVTMEDWNLQRMDNSNERIQKIINSGEDLIGTPYEWGGNSPGGFDCSGLMQYIFKENGISLPRTAAEQQQCGTAVPYGELQPGDLVFWGDPAYHVAIYIGNGQILTSPHTGTTVTTMNLYPYTNARKII